MYIFAFLRKIRKFKMAAVLENFLKSGIGYCLNALGAENFAEIALSVTVKEIQAQIGENIQNLAFKWPSLAYLLQVKAGN